MKLNALGVSGHIEFFETLSSDSDVGVVSVGYPL